MIALENDVIAGVATPPGRGGVAVIRLSGAGTLQKLLPHLRPSALNLAPRTLHLVEFLDSNSNSGSDPETRQKIPLDRMLVVHFPEPHSFTGEEVVELHCHGAPVLVQCILEILTASGIRLAQPGEFSRRAFLNGKMDLTQAEALMRLIEAGSLRAARQASKQLRGSLSKKLHAARKTLLETLARLEAELDFSEDVLENPDQRPLVQTLMNLSSLIDQLLQGAVLGRHLQEGMDLAIVGRPNVGKSTLFNRLTGYEKAIVTEISGTTRDLLEQSCTLCGVPVTLVDTAGQRDDRSTRIGTVEREGMRRARRRAGVAEIVLLVVEADRGWLAEDQKIFDTLHRDRTLIVWNKMDRCTGLFTPPPNATGPAISAKTGENFQFFVKTLSSQLGEMPQEEAGALIMEVRQKASLQKTYQALQETIDLLMTERPTELAAFSLREALKALGEITGEVTHEEVLDQIFSRFCIGK